MEPKPSKHVCLNFGFDGIRQEILLTPNFGSPLLFFCIRTLFFVWITIVIVSSLALDPFNWWTYFTNLSYCGLFLLFASYMIISVLNFCQKKVHRVFLVWTNINYEIMLTAHIIVPLIYWIFLSSELEESDAPTDYWIAISMHGMDFVVIFVEFMFCKTPVFPIHFVFGIVIVWLYIFFSMVIYAVQGIWVYDFLDYSTPIIAAIYVGFTIGAVLLHLMWFGFTEAKKKCFPQVYLDIPEMRDLEKDGENPKVGEV